MLASVGYPILGITPNLIELVRPCVLVTDFRLPCFFHLKMAAVGTSFIQEIQDDEKPYYKGNYR